MRSSSLSRSTSNVSSLREALLTRAADALARACAGTVGESAGFGDFEAQPNACANEALRRQVQQALEQIEQRHGERLVVEGKRHRRHECGRVPHTARRRPRASIDLSLAVRNGPTIVRLELAAGLLHRSSPALASSIAQGYGGGTDTPLPSAHAGGTSRSASACNGARKSAALRGYVCGVIAWLMRPRPLLMAPPRIAGKNHRMREKDARDEV